MKTKKKFLTILLTVCLVMAMIPMTVLAADEKEADKTVITSVEELLQFAQAVNTGEYDKKTDAIVVLDADLDLTGAEWTPIGSVEDAEGNIEHYFSGKFYGNGHTVSNLDFSSIYGEGMVSGFFGDIEGAEVSDLTIKGTVNVTGTPDYTYFGAITGYAAGCKITNCISEVSFTNNGKYVYGFIGMCGYAEDTTISYCQSKGNIQITGDMGSLYAGGIAGYVKGESEISFCANTGDMMLSASNGGELVGRLLGNAKLVNCYAVGKLTPVGKGTTDLGGLVGTVANGTTVNHCYFAGELDLSQYTATTIPYSRLGGIVGKADSGTVNFENNYFTEKENVNACGNNAEAGTAKAFEYMRSEDFYKEICAGGGNYQYRAGETPVFPELKHTVTFVVTPEGLTNVSIKVNGQEVTSNTIDLAKGTYTIEVTADDCEPFSKEITVTDDIATHTQTLEMTYQSADYSKVEEAIEKANGLNKEDYKDFTKVEEAINAVVRGKNIKEQAEVDEMAKAIEDAIAALEKKPAQAGSKTDQNTKTNTKTNPKADSSGIPKTGDHENAGLMLAMLYLSGAVIAGSVVIGKKKKYRA